MEKEFNLNKRLRETKLKNKRRLIELKQDEVRMGKFFMNREELNFLRGIYGK